MAKEQFSGAVVAHFLPPWITEKLALTPAHFGVSDTAEGSAQETLTTLGISLEEPDNLHMTLAYLGDASDLEEGAIEQLRAAVATVASHRGDYLTATVAGLARFTNPPPGKPQPLVALLDVPWLTWLVTDLQTALYKQGAPAADDHTHGFLPHVTLAYLAPDVATPSLRLPPFSWPLSSITLGVGGVYEHYSLGARNSVVIETKPETRNRSQSQSQSQHTPTADLEEDDSRRKHLVARLTEPYQWGSDHITELAKSIYLARVSAYTASYRQQVKGLGGTISATWQPSSQRLAQQAQLSLDAAQHIASTYHHDLETATQGIVAGYVASHQTRAVGDVLHQLATTVANWVQRRSNWKTTQIAQHETIAASNQATTDLYRDLNSWEEGDELADDPDALEELDLSGVDLERVVVQVDPGDSSEDGCMEWAGQTFPYDDWDNVPDFPMHIGCIHVKYLAYA